MTHASSSASFAIRAASGARRDRRLPSLRGTTVAMLAAGVLSSAFAQSAAGRFESLSQDQPTRTTGTQLSGDKPSVFSGRASSGLEYRANAAIASLTIEVEQDGLPADGQAANRITVRAFDANGAPVAGDTLLTVEITGGRMILPGASTDEYGPDRRDVDSLVPGVQLPVTNGVATFTLLAPFEPKDVRVRVTGGAQEVTGVVSYLPDLREMIAAGVIDGILNFKRRSGDSLLQARTEDGFDREMRHWQRSFSDDKRSVGASASMFLKGKILGQYLLTAAYDSDKDTRRRLQDVVRPEEFYPVYGDAALRGTDVRSSSKLFVRVDSGKSFALFGDFSTGVESPPQSQGTSPGLRLRDLGNYQRNITGAQWHYENARASVNVFAARDNLKQVIDEFQGQGISGPYALSNNGAILGTERVELITRDRNQRSVILSTQVLVPLVDYSFEPFSGRLLFKQPVPSLDANLNPVFVRVTYELEQDGPKFWLGGVDAQVRVLDNVEVGGSVVKDNNPLAKYSLASANVGVRLGPKTMFVAEAARTQSDVNTSGSNTSSAPGLVGKTGEVTGRAWRTEIRHEAERWNLRGFYGRSDPEFNNPAASLYGGRVEAGVRGDYKVTEPAMLYGQALRSEDRVTGGKRTGGDVGLRYKFTPSFELDFGLRTVRESGDSSTTPASIGFGGGTGQTGTGSGGFGSNGSFGSGGVFGGNSGFGGTGNNTNGNGFYGVGTPSNNGFVNNGGFTDTGKGAAPVNADTARIGLRWKPLERWTLLGEVEADVHGADKRRIAVGADYQLTERSKVYARFENQNGLASVLSVNPADKSRAFVVGVASSYLTNTEVYSEYRLRDAVSGDVASARDVQLATGAQRTINVSPGLRFTASAEHLKVVGGGGRAAVALAGGVDYTASEWWKLGSRLEYRRVGDDKTTTANDRQDSWLSTVSVARKIDRDWTALVRNYLLFSDDKSLGGDRLQLRTQIGAAYRPVDSTRFDALMKVEHKIDKNGELVTGAETIRTTIASVHGVWHPSRPWWLSGRLASKWQKDPYGRYDAYLASGRATWDFTEKWDASVLTSLKYAPQGSTKQWAQGVEVGYALQQNLWLSAGYNWTGFSDKDLQGADYTNRGGFLRLRFKFDEDLFRGKDARANKLLGDAPAAAN